MTLRSPPREIIAVLVVKLLALTAIYALFFSPAHRPAVDASQRLLGVSSLSTPHR